MCALFAVDIAGFTGPHRDDDIRLYLHEELYQVLHKAFDGSGIPWADCFCEDRGDGALIVVPPVVPCKGLIDPLPERLRGLIRRHNHVSRDAAGIQLRAAAHIGPVEYDGHGFVGTDINLLFRMLDARPFEKPWSKNAQLRTEQVEAMQRKLTERGLYNDKIDGKAGMLTRAALGAYQKANGLHIDCWPTAEVLTHMRGRR